jgi:CheY-like chemotaxis protein
MMLDCDDTSELREYINNIRESGNLLLSIINNILDQSKIEAGRIDIEHIPFSLESIISAAAGAASVLLAQTGKTVSIRQSVAPGIAKLLMGDPTRVLQVLNNLMSNAVKFTPDGFIEFGATLKEPSMLEFYVRDTGPGIEPACHEKIFEPFQQADTTITRNYGGTGLGLAISKKLTELMGGELRLTSGTGRAHGSTFYFTIPYEPLDDCADEAVTAPDKTEGRRPRVLVAEDNRTSGKIIGRLLEKLGCDVERAHDGRDAISKYKTIPGIDVIFMDIRMPVLDGKKSTAIIRTIEQKEKRRRIPIVALSASAMSDDRKQCLKAGCDLYMKKPVSTETLSRILDQLKKNPAARHAFQ